MSNEFGNIEIKKSGAGKLVVNGMGDIYKIVRVKPFVELKLAVKESSNALESYRVEKSGVSVDELEEKYNVKWLEFDRDTYETPAYVFNWLDSRFNFNLDGCASEGNRKTYFFSSDFLNIDVEKAEEEICGDKIISLDVRASKEKFEHKQLRIFVNPPYSDPAPFLQKAKELRDSGCLVVFLLNDDKSTKWYANHVRNVANEIINITGGRLSFIHPITKEPVNGNSKGQFVVVFDPAMDDFVMRDVSLQFIQEKFNDC